MFLKKDKFTDKDILFMSLALNLARSRHGLTGKNPSVGCVIVKNNKIISIGQTGFNGRPHAEYNAIMNTIEELKGSTMYVSLEPCNHYGVTPPCTKQIIKSKIGKVIYSIDDIDKKVKGKSFKILRSNNIQVKKGLLKKEFNNFYAPYFFNRKMKRPYVTGKIAISKNNLIYSKKTKKITDIHSDKFTHFLRYQNDSIMVTSKTLNIDNPKLSCRLKGLSKFSPIRVILDRNLKMKMSSYIFRTANKHNTILFYQNYKKLIISKLKKKGVQLVKINSNRNKLFDIKHILKKLYIFGCRNLLIEGGNDLTKDMLKSKLFNEFYLFKSQKILSKSNNFKEFNCFKNLTQNYKNKAKLNTKLGKDSVVLYKK